MKCKEMSLEFCVIIAEMYLEQVEIIGKCEGKRCQAYAICTEMQNSFHLNANLLPLSDKIPSRNHPAT